MTITIRAFFSSILISFVALFGALKASSFLDANGQRIELKVRALPERHNECHLCHTKKTREFMGQKTRTILEHKGKSSEHGHVEVACQNCHDINKSNYLLSNSSIEISWENSSGVCQRCHPNRYRDWKTGAHGKRSGSWKSSFTQYHCIDCHDPHSVKFKIMDAIKKPPESKFRIKKENAHGQEE